MSLFDLTYAELEKRLVADGLKPIHTHALWHALYRDLATDLNGTTDFLPPLQRWVQQQIQTTGVCPPPPLQPVSEVASGDGLTRKFLLRLSDDAEIETVLMGYPGRFTACLSTQVGCAMGCVFCATGQMGFRRHLQPGEIVAQVLHVQRALKTQGTEGLRNLVLMGMGEPLHNYDAVMTALEIITDTRGLNLGARRISISTVGIVPGILRLAEEQSPYNLAVSLHGATDATRSALVPVSQRWPLSDLIAACHSYGAKTGRRIFFEWTLIANTNDSPTDAEQLAHLLHGLNAHINLIPLNTTDGYEGQASQRLVVHTFQQRLRAAGFPCTIRQRRGLDVAAGCGQLQVNAT